MRRSAHPVAAAAGFPVPRGRPLRLLMSALVTAVLLAGCGTPTVDRADPSTAPSAITATETDTVVAQPVASSVARVRGEIEVRTRPRDDAPTQVLPATTDFGSPTVLLVSKVGTGRRDGWLEVLLPIRPNGATGWIRADDVDLHDVTLEVRIDLTARELTVLDAGAELLTTEAAIGQAENPTPTGRFYVIDKLETPDPGGAYGPYAIGLSAHSDVLTEFAGGDGQIGIHGTNAPDSVGRAVSHGCVRVDNTVIERLAHLLPLGTPVAIV